MVCTRFDASITPARIAPDVIGNNKVVGSYCRTTPMPQHPNPCYWSDSLARGCETSIEMDMVYLVIAAHSKEPCRQKLTTGSLTLGRAIGCQIWVDDAKLSREHCRIERVGDDWFVEDLKSTNGTWMHGRQIARAPLNDGDSFEAGDTRFIFNAGEHLQNRPRDPIEAQQLRRMHPSSDPSQETLVAHPPMLNGRLTPVPKPRAG